MRIAIIADASIDGPGASELRAAASLASSLLPQLKERGHEVTWMEVSSDPIGSDLMLARLAARANDFDLVHTFAGHRSLTYLGNMRTVIVAWVSPELIAAAPAIYRHFHERVHYVASSVIDSAEGLRVETVIEPGQGVSPFDKLYTTLVARAARIDRRPWGYYEVLADEPDHKVKRIVVYPGKRLSLQRHRRRSEHWFIVSGEAVATRDEESIRLAAGRCFEIPVGAWHRIHNPATSDMAFIEVQTGNYFGEDDIERGEDDFGRV
jgi:mannose-6-phosphate isomerase